MLVCTYLLNQEVIYWLLKLEITLEALGAGQPQQGVVKIIVEKIILIQLKQKFSAMNLKAFW